MLWRLRFVTRTGAASLTTGTIDEPIGMTLRIERTRARLSLTHVARAIGVSVGHLSRMETGERSLDPEMVERIRVAIRSARRVA